MNKQQVLLQHFGLGLILLTPAVLIVAILAGHLLSRKVLTPVAVIANEARRISDKNLDKRLPVSPADDELSHLSITLNNMLARIDAGYRSVRNFTANASHELRTPLARLRTEIEIALLSSRSVDEYRDALEQMQSVTVDMTSMIESLLTLARAEAGADVSRRSAIDLKPMIETILQEWSPVAEELAIELRCEIVESNLFDESADWLVLGDRSALRRLLCIWLDNACKFTPAGGHISILAERAGETVLLAIEDSGIGIPEDQQEKIFERFYRVQGDESAQRYGSGLGLSLAAWIADQHGTRITLRSAPGEGSRFQIALLRAQRENLPIQFAADTALSNTSQALQ